MKPPTTQDLRIIIVGGGASSALAALNLSRCGAASSITVISPDRNVGRGLAYSAKNKWHRLNVPAHRMGGVYDDDPSGFADWLTGHGVALGPDYAKAFAPRSVYGDYLSSRFNELVAADSVDVVIGRAVALTCDGHIKRVRTATGETLTADVVILCLGNHPPAQLPRFAPSPRLINDVWSPGAFDSIDTKDNVLIVGTAATAVDVVVDLHHRGQTGQMTMVSRRGLLPRADVPAVEDPMLFEVGTKPTVRGLFQQIRRNVEMKTRLGLPWQSVIDGFRREISRVWQDLPSDERARFGRHLRSLWLVHRHRLPPDTAQLLADLQRSGRLTIVSGRIQAAAAHDAGYNVTIKPRGAAEFTQTYNRVTNCTGPDERYERIDNPLIADMLTSGFARPGPMGLGLDVDQYCRLAAGDVVRSGVYVIGQATRGAFWEVTSATDVRRQAIEISAHIREFACGTPVN